jgi:hypothetical protein
MGTDHRGRSGDGKGRRLIRGNKGAAGREGIIRIPGLEVDVGKAMMSEIGSGEGLKRGWVVWVVCFGSFVHGSFLVAKKMDVGSLKTDCEAEAVPNDQQKSFKLGSQPPRSLNGSAPQPSQVQEQQSSHP